MRARRLARVVVCALALVAQRAEAAAPAPLAESLEGQAKRAYDAGKLLFADKDFAGASIKFREALEESGDARLLWNIAASEKNQRHYEKAVAYIRRYLAEAAALVTEEQRTSAEQALAALEGFLGEVSLTVDPGEARVLVDGEERPERGAARVLRLDQGKRAIRAEREGFTPFETALEVVGGKRFTLPIVLAPLPKPAPKLEPAALAEPAPVESPPQEPLTALTPPRERAEAFTILDVHWGWWAAGAAALTTAVTLTALALSSGDASAPPVVSGTLGSVRLPLGAW